MTAGRVMLISPKFHGYWQSMQHALERLGYEVVPHIYDDFSTPWAKLQNKVQYEFAERRHLGAGLNRFSVDATQSAQAALRLVRPDYIVAIKADCLGGSFWDDVDRLGIPKVLWLYDELRRTMQDPQDLKRFPSIVSYSRDDIAMLAGLGIDAGYLPTGFDKDFSVTPNPSGDVVFIGACYPNRRGQLEALSDAGVQVKVFGREWSHHPFDRVRTWQWERPNLPAGRDVSRVEAYRLMSGAVAAVNIHSNQDGFTMRTFEAPGVGALQIIDRTDVDEFYDPGTEVLTYQSVEELADHCKRSANDPGWRRSIGEAGRKRTLAQHTFDHRMAKLVDLWA